MSKKLITCFLCITLLLTSSMYIFANIESNTLDNSRKLENMIDEELINEELINEELIDEELIDEELIDEELIDEELID